jgi:hypothetical protein
MFKMLVSHSLIFLALMFSALFSHASAQSVEREYLPFSESKLRRFPLKRTELTREAIMSEQGVVISAVRMREEDEPERVLVFSGRDVEGKEWRVETGGIIYYEAVYEGDLDRNGRPDLILSAGTGGNGLAPPTQLVFLTFDRRGRPTLFEATGYFETQPDRIFDLADMDGDGRAELLFMNYDDGYWVTNLYRVRESRWSRVEGRFSGLSFPLYTRFTRRPNHRPVRPARGRKPVAPDLLKEQR